MRICYFSIRRAELERTRTALTQLYLVGIRDTHRASCTQRERRVNMAAVCTLRKVGAVKRDPVYWHSAIETGALVVLLHIYKNWMKE